MYPKDERYEEVKVEQAEPMKGGGWSIKRDDGWSFFVPPESPIVPAPGMTARFYGQGIGYQVRGLFLDGQQVYYRTEAEEKEKHAIDTYGADCADWLARWDAGKTVWTVEMGGMGPGYEQCIAIVTAEVLRHLLEAKYDAQRWEVKELWAEDREAIDKAGFANPVIDKLGITGAQWGAAMNVATRLYMKGPRECLTDSRIKDRLIMVSKHFPQAEVAA
jgi:hypothetical protein